MDSENQLRDFSFSGKHFSFYKPIAYAYVGKGLTSKRYHGYHGIIGITTDIGGKISYYFYYIYIIIFILYINK